MALKSTVFKAHLQIADMDRSLYADHALTLARHPSENDERMMVRLLAYALSAPADTLKGALEFTAGLSDIDAPDIWQRDLTGDILQWIEIGQPDDRRLAKACGRAEVVKVWCFSHAAPIWWQGIENKVVRLANLEVWQVPSEASKELALMAERSMKLQVTVQEGQIWFGDANRSVALELKALKSTSQRR